LIVDIHTHVWWYPDHIGEKWASEALASKLVKLERSGGERTPGRSTSQLRLPAGAALEASAGADKVVVFGAQAASASGCPTR